MQVLISNRALPSESIGSWTTQMTSLIEDGDLFDYVLSPSRRQHPSSVHCRKRRLLTHARRVRRSMLRLWVARDYLRALSRLLRDVGAGPATVTVVDDPHLLAAVASFAQRAPRRFELVFAFHGFELSLEEELVNRVDTVLFLTRSGYRASLQRYRIFTPRVVVVGNPVDSALFFPLDAEAKRERKRRLGLDPERPVVVWMANDRPEKGGRLFLRLRRSLSQRFPELQFLMVGADDSAPDGVVSVGRVPNREVASFLQAGDFFLMPTLVQEGLPLAPIEAAKCGNIVVASDRGGVREALEGIAGCHLVRDPNIEAAWIDAFSRAMGDHPLERSRAECDAIWPAHLWKERMREALAGRRTD